MFGPIEITRGCAFACSYCQTSHIFRRFDCATAASAASCARQKALRSVNRKVVRLLSPNAFFPTDPPTDGNSTCSHARIAGGLREASPPTAIILRALSPRRHARTCHAGNARPVEGIRGQRRNCDRRAIRQPADAGRLPPVSHRRKRPGSRVAGAKIRIQGHCRFYFRPARREADWRRLAVIEEVVRMGARIHPHFLRRCRRRPLRENSPDIISAGVREAMERFASRRGTR